MGESIIRQIDKKLFRTIRIVTGLKWTIATLSFIGIAIAIFLYFFRDKNMTSVVPSKNIAQFLKNGNLENTGGRINIVSYDKHIDNNLKEQIS